MLRAPRLLGWSPRGDGLAAAQRLAGDRPSRGEPGVEVGLEVVDVLEADREPHEARRDAAEAEAHRPTTRTTRGDLCAVCRRVCGLLRMCEGDPRDLTASAYVVIELNTPVVLEFVPKYYLG